MWNLYHLLTIYLANLQEKSLSSSAELFKLSVMIMKVRFDITPMSTLMLFAYNMIILNHPVPGVVAAAALPRRRRENPSWPWAPLLRYTGDGLGIWSMAATISGESPWKIRSFKGNILGGLLWPGCGIMQPTKWTMSRAMTVGFGRWIFICLIVLEMSLA